MKPRLTASILLAAAAWSQTPPRAPLYEPAISPDRQEIAFVSAGDIWRVPANGGEASLLVAHPADESRPVYSPDGKRLAFISSRTGNGDIYVATLATGEVRRITYSDSRDQLDAWSRDGQWLYFHSSSGDIAAMNDVYRVRATGGTPMPVAADRYVNEFFAAPSPDGKTVALNARGIAAAQWWRKGHSHIDTSEIYLVTPGAVPDYDRMTDGAAKEIWPMWAGDGKSIFFVSDRNGVENIWRQPVGGTSKQITTFKDGRVLWPSISNDGRLLVFERGFQIWKIDTNNGRAAMVPISLRGAPAEAGITHLNLSEGFSDLALSPDGKKMAITVRGEIFAAPVQSPGEAHRVTRSPANDFQAAWSPDSSKLVYASGRNGHYQLFEYDFAAQTETQLTYTESSDAIPRYSPDGKKIAFLRGGTGVWIYDVEKKDARQLAAADVDRQPLVSGKELAWSPDSRWLAFAARGARGFTNVMVAPEAGGPAEPVSFLANGHLRTIQWSPDGRHIYFNTAQRTEPSRVARVDLRPADPEFRENRFRDLFQSTKPATTKNTGIVFDQIRSRLTMLSVGLDVNDFELSHDGKQMLFTAQSGGQSNLYSFPLDVNPTTPPTPRQLTSTAGRKSDAQWLSGDKEAFFLERGRVQAVSLETRAPRTLAVTAEMDVDFHQQKQAVFQQAWTSLNDHFFDGKFNGADWPALRAQYQPLVAAARTPTELYRTAGLMIGELNASHLGISRIQAPAPVNGRLGLRFDPAVAEVKGQFVILDVTPLGPAALAGLKAGDVVASIDGTNLGAGVSIDSLLDHKVRKRVQLTLANGRKIAIQPIAITDEKRLVYRAWVEQKRSYVEKASGGKLGYVHLQDMSADSLDRLHLDLDAANHAKEGVVIDVRHNSGGFVNAYALDVFSRRGYLTFLARGSTAVPARSVLGQRSLELPTILVTNQHSLSDAEDFSEGYRRLKIGKVVGEPTAGWIVYTWNEQLVDGSSLRLPRIKVFDNDGTLMEMHPRPVDVPVQRPVGESYTGRDTQLDTAVRELLAQIDAAKGRLTPPTNQ